MLRRLRQLTPVLAACALVLAQAPASSAQDLVAKWEYAQKAGTTEKLTDDDIRDLVEFLRIL